MGRPHRRGARTSSARNGAPGAHRRGADGAATNYGCPPRLGPGEEGERLFLASATSHAALASAVAEGGGYLVPLDGAGPPRFLSDPGDALVSYRLLAPQVLYNVLTERFHRIVATPDGTALQATALPLVLEDGPAGPIGDYHAVRLP